MDKLARIFSLGDSLSRTTTSPDVVQFNLAQDTRLRFQVYGQTSDGASPYLAANVMVGGEWLGMKRLVTW